MGCQEVFRQPLPKAYRVRPIATTDIYLHHLTKHRDRDGTFTEDSDGETTDTDAG